MERISDYMQVDYYYGTELEKNVSLIERKKRGQGKPTLIYMKKFMECDVAEDVMMKEVEQPIAKESEII